MKRLFLCLLLFSARPLYSLIQIGEIEISPDDRPLSANALDFDYSTSIESQTSVKLKGYGSLGQVATATLDGGSSDHTAVSIDHFVIETGSMDSVDVHLLPLEFSEGVEVYQNNLSALGIQGSSGLLNFTLPDCHDDFTLISGGTGNLGFYQSKVLFCKNHFLFGLSYSQAENNFESIDDLGITNQNLNLDYRRASVLLKSELSNLNLLLLHSYREGGGGSLYSGNGRNTDHFSMANISAPISVLFSSLSYLRWENVYSNTASGNARTVNHTLSFSGKSEFETEKTLLSLLVSEQFFYVNSSASGEHPENDFFVSESFTQTLGKFRFGTDSSVGFTQGKVYFVPALSFSLPFDLSQIYIRISRAYRPPTVNDLYWPFDGYAEGNLDLLPEDGVRLKSGALFLLNQVSLKASFTYSRLQNLILWSSGTDSVWRPVNIRKTESFIANAAITYFRFLRQFYFSVSSSISLNHSRNSELTSVYFQMILPYTPKVKISAGLEMKYSDLIKVEVTFYHVGKRFVTEANTASLPAYQDISLKFEILHFYFEGNNLLNQSYEHQQGYPALPRNFSAGISAEF